MASPTRWTWVWASSVSWWLSGKPGVLQSMGSQRVGHNWATELNWTKLNTVKDFSVVNKADVDVFRDISCFFMIQSMLAIWSLVPLPFLIPFCTSGSSQFVYLKPSWKDFEHYVASMWDECTCVVVWPFFGIVFGIGRKIELFLSCGHFWVFQISWLIEWSTLTAASFMIWNILAGIPSPPLAVFLVMLPKTHLTLPQDVWLLVSDHTIVVISVIKTFFCAVLLCILFNSS